MSTLKRGFYLEPETKVRIKSMKLKYEGMIKLRLTQDEFFREVANNADWILHNMAKTRELMTSG